MNDYDNEDYDNEDVDRFDDLPDDTEPQTVPCPDCGTEVYEDTPRCPVCGSYIVHDTSVWAGRSLGWIVLGLIGILAVLVALTLRF